MIIDPKQATTKDIYKAMIGSIVPRPIAFVSTVSSDGYVNLAPFSFFTGITSKPPTICFAPGRRASDGEHKDTLNNVRQTGEFVVNVVTADIGAAMNETATEFPPETDEFDVAGLTSIASDVVKPPRVAESPINMECTLNDIVDVGSGSLVIGEIVLFHIADALYDAGHIDVTKLNPLGRLAGDNYVTLGDIVTHVRKPPTRKP